jgi:hypothetical protein
MSSTPLSSSADKPSGAKREEGVCSGVLGWSTRLGARKADATVRKQARNVPELLNVVILYSILSFNSSNLT